jgi:HEXXH motif-containing protein
VTPRLDEPWRLPGLEISVAAAPPNADWLWPRVIPAPPDVAADVLAGGLQLADIKEGDIRMFAQAAEAIAWVPSLAAIVTTRVNAIHLLHGEPGYDVSHSEPHWRDRIFVSVPERRDKIGALRLAEGVIHEALHLHLTEFEMISPLVQDRAATLASPWRPDPRSYGGVLHGAFVFMGLNTYFDIISAPSDSGVGPYVEQRRTEIAQQLAEVDVVGLRVGLTASGTALLSRLFGVPATRGDDQSTHV